MDFQQLYLTNSGRISRKTWWIGTLLLIVASFVLYFILGLVGLGVTSTFGPIIVYLALIFPALNIGLKRRQDRDNDGTDYKIFMGLSAVVTLLQAFNIGNARTASPDMWMTGVSLLLGIFAIYIVVQIGFLKGTTGPNSYGPDPLGYAAA
ncbi:DUF805 domain-containing protein [Devosia sp. SL43]|uniref:DUF805 domain-containing protein n=1 Tax=Devosia sp. SL43 TaxID=2806348 RepID=UPI001F159DB0|nr:DUF805 domain-containing protein [Devosia sp. SL43]UJW84891.1 DUF805 domain-containing protein [Devosia sp. SL43]